MARVERPRLRSVISAVGPAARGAVASGAGSNASPAAAAPSRSASSSPTWSVRSGTVPSRSSARRKTAGSGLGAPASADETTVSKRSPTPARSSWPARVRPSSRRRRARDRPSEAARARRRRRRAVETERADEGRRELRPGRVGRPGARGRRRRTGARDRAGSRRPGPPAPEGRSTRPRLGTRPAPRGPRRCTPRSSSARGEGVGGVGKLDERAHRVDGERVEAGGASGTHRGGGHGRRARALLRHGARPRCTSSEGRMAKRPSLTAVREDVRGSARSCRRVTRLSVVARYTSGSSRRRRASGKASAAGAAPAMLSPAARRMRSPRSVRAGTVMRKPVSTKAETIGSPATRASTFRVSRRIRSASLRAFTGSPTRKPRSSVPRTTSSTDRVRLDVERGLALALRAGDVERVDGGRRDDEVGAERAQRRPRPPGRFCRRRSRCGARVGRRRARLQGGLRRRERRATWPGPSRARRSAGASP